VESNKPLYRITEFKKRGERSFINEKSRRRKNLLEKIRDIRGKTREKNEIEIKRFAFTGGGGGGGGKDYRENEWEKRRLRKCRVYQ